MTEGHRRACDGMKFNAQHDSRRSACVKQHKRVAVSLMRSKQPTMIKKKCSLRQMLMACADLDLHRSLDLLPHPIAATRRMMPSANKLPNLLHGSTPSNEAPSSLVLCFVGVVQRRSSGGPGEVSGGPTDVQPRFSGGQRRSAKGEERAGSRCSPLKAFAARWTQVTPGCQVTL